MRAGPCWAPSRASRAPPAGTAGHQGSVGLLQDVQNARPQEQWILTFRESVLLCFLRNPVLVPVSNPRWSCWGAHSGPCPWREECGTVRCHEGGTEVSPAQRCSTSLVQPLPSPLPSPPFLSSWIYHRPRLPPPVICSRVGSPCFFPLCC